MENTASLYSAVSHFLEVGDLAGRTVSMPPLQNLSRHFVRVCVFMSRNLEIRRAEKCLLNARMATALFRTRSVPPLICLLKVMISLGLSFPENSFCNSDKEIL